MRLSVVCAAIWFAAGVVAPGADDPIAEGMSVRAHLRRVECVAQLRRWAAAPYMIAAALQSGELPLGLLMDVIYPQSIPHEKLEPGELEKLVQQLASDEYTVAKKAVNRIFLAGPSVRARLQELLKGADPAVLVLARSIMAEWDAASVDDELLKSLDGPLGGIFERFGRMHNKLHIAPGIGERIVRIRTSGPSRGSGHMLTYITRLIVATGDDRLINELAPMVNHPDDSIAVEVVGDLGMGRNSEFMPELLLKALNSDRHKLVAEALKWVPGYSGNSRNTELRQALTRIFESDDEELKFHASFALLHEYQDQRAMNYLAEQAMGKDTERVRRALTWLGDNALEGHPVFPKLLEAVDRHLASDQTMLRKAAVRALNPYTGTEVLARLVPLLVSEDQALVEQAAYILRQYRDKQSLKAALQKAVKSEDSELAKRAKEILDSLR